jgi:hypothetical protein
LLLYLTQRVKHVATRIMTLATITANRDAAKLAYESALQALSYTMNMGGTSRSKTNIDVDKAREHYEYWEARVDTYNGTTRRVKFGTARI